MVSVLGVGSAHQRECTDHGHQGPESHEAGRILAFGRARRFGLAATIANNDLAEHLHGDVGLTGVVEGGVLGERVVESDVGCDGP